MGEKNSESTEQNKRSDKDLPLNEWYSILTSKIFAAPTIFLTSATFLFYLISYEYYSAFFRGLSLPYRELDLPVTFFLPEVFIIVLLYILIIYILLPIVNNYEFFFYKKNKKELLLCVFVVIATLCLSLMVIFAPFGLSGWKISNASAYIKLIQILIYFISLFILILLSRCVYGKIDKKDNEYSSLIEKEFKTMCSSRQKSRKIGSVLFISCIYVFIFADIMGGIHAELLLHGFLWNTRDVTLFIKDENNDAIKNQSLEDLRLVMYLNNKYYLVDKNTPHLEYPELYIIPDDSVQLAKIRRVDRWREGAPFLVGILTFNKRPKLSSLESCVIYNTNISKKTQSNNTDELDSSRMPYNSHENDAKSYRELTEIETNLEPKQEIMSYATSHSKEISEIENNQEQKREIMSYATSRSKEISEIENNQEQKREIMSYATSRSKEISEIENNQEQKREIVSDAIKKRSEKICKGDKIIWTAYASDPDNDEISYKFGVRKYKGKWWDKWDKWEEQSDFVTNQNTWNWTPEEIGTYEVDVLVEDDYYRDRWGHDNTTCTVVVISRDDKDQYNNLDALKEGLEDGRTEKKSNQAEIKANKMANMQNMSKQ